MKPKLLDLFCCAGGCSEGYRRAGFEPYGIDIDSKPLRHYPFPYICMDALEAMSRLLAGEGLTFSNGETLYLKDFAAFHASPPCQFASEAVPIAYRANTPNLISPTRERLMKTNKPFVIENVDNAREFLRSPIRLHGSMFGLKVHRSRYFEIYPEHLIVLLNKPYPSKNPVVPTGHSNKRVNGERVPQNKIEEIREAMQMPWATGEEISQAIHPVFTEFIGKYLIGVSNL